MENNTQMEPRGFEPLTSSVQGRRSPNLNYGPSDLRPSGQAPHSTPIITQTSRFHLLVHPFASQLTNGPSWSRTTDLALIRGVL